LIGVALLLASAAGGTWKLCCAASPIARDLSIAALPFRVADPALAAYREGLVDYFSSALDGPGGLRTIGARTTLKRWYASVGRSRDGDDETVRRVARDLGARFALTGAVIPLGAGIRLTTEIHDLAGDSTIHAEADGPADSISVLAGRTGAELLRRIAGPTAKLVTAGPFATHSLQALKAYLEGEKAFREALYPDALAAFDRALAADSSFVLAQFRRGAAAGWTRSPHDPAGVHRSVLAALPRLGRHDSLMVRGSWELGKQLRGALTSFAMLTREYPEDAEAWYLLGDAYYHLGMLHGISPATVDSAFRRAIALDSAFAPAYLHLIEDAFERTDSAEAGVLIRALARFDSTSPKTTGLRVAWALAFGKEHERELAKQRLPALGADALLPAKHAMNLNPDFADWTELVGRAIYSNSRNGPVERAQGMQGAGGALQLRGRFGDSWSPLLIYTTLVDSAGWPWPAFYSDIGPAFLRLEGLPVRPGWDTMPSPDRLPGYDPVRSGNPSRVWVLGAWGLARDRGDVVARAIVALRHAADTLVGGSSLPDSMERAEDHAWTMSLAAQLESWRKWNRSPTEASLRAFADATDSLRNYDPWVTPADFILGKAYLAAGDLERAERYMLTPQRWLAGAGIELMPIREYYLGRIAEERGRRTEAREHYARFVRWWHDCDPELRGWWEDGRQALPRVSEEPRNGEGDP